MAPSRGTENKKVTSLVTEYIYYNKKMRQRYFLLTYSSWTLPIAHYIFVYIFVWKQRARFWHGGILTVTRVGLCKEKECEFKHRRFSPDSL